MKKVSINYFKIISRYHVDDGYVHLMWNVQDAFIVILFSRKFFKLIDNQNEIKILTNKSQNYRLLAIGLFSFSIKTINTKSINASVIKKNLGKIVSKQIKTKEYINPKLIEVELKKNTESPRFKKSNIKLKIINP